METNLKRKTNAQKLEPALRGRTQAKHRPKVSNIRS